MSDKGFLSFFFGKRKKIKNLKSPYSFTVNEQLQPNRDKTLVMFVKKCDVQYIFDSESWKCVDRNSTTGIKTAIHRLDKYNDISLDGNLIKGLIQFKDNCWFNSLLMCLFFSDRSRKLMNDKRRIWITTKTTNATKKYILNVFTYLMEIPHYNSNLVNNIDSNMILKHLHSFDKDIFDHSGYTGGNGILYFNKLLRLLGFMLSEFLEIRVIYVDADNTTYIQVNDKVVHKHSGLIEENYINNLVTDNVSNNHKMLALYVSGIPIYKMPQSFGKMRLDSIYLSNFRNDISDSRHAVAGIMCNNYPFLYDGQRALMDKMLKPFKWSIKSKTSSFAMTYNTESIMGYNFDKGSKIGFFISI